MERNDHVLDSDNPMKSAGWGIHIGSIFGEDNGFIKEASNEASIISVFFGPRIRVHGGQGPTGPRKIP
jgi:hypothetical protein